ncbi:MAG: rod shape-determining protein RodA [Bacteroidales bacterium]|nr:rod shape-determining protein RodA [Bacteroidales bacterium]MDD4575602.1 rod shape-determining protein RodA [Bacteroidales bacterium]
MSQRIGRQSMFANIDWILVAIYFLLVFVGWINIYAATYTPTSESIFDLDRNSGRQFLWILISMGVALIIILIDAKVYTTFTWVFYGITTVLILLVIFVGTEVSGAKSWLGVGDLGIQPSEFAKITAAMALAKYAGESNRNVEQLRVQIISFILIFVPALIILMQNDTGSALVFVVFLFVLYREGMPGTILWIGLTLIVIFLLTLLFSHWHVIIAISVLTLFMWFFIRRYRKDVLKMVLISFMLSSFSFGVDYIFDNILQPHQKSRIEVLIGTETDLRGAGYNVNQSKIAIGSGGFFGKGFLKGTQTKYKFVPEQSTDFIFCTIGEEWGFLGSFLVIVLFLLLLIRIILLSERQRSRYSRIYGYGIAGVLFTHIAVNIGMTLGLMPVIGIPLPYISYGGSSLIAFTMMLFIFIKLDMNRQNIV